MSQVLDKRFCIKKMAHMSGVRRSYSPCSDLRSLLATYRQLTESAAAIPQVTLTMQVVQRQP